MFFRLDLILNLGDVTSHVSSTDTGSGAVGIMDMKWYITAGDVDAASRGSLDTAACMKG